jgi:hypothetical protein
MRQLLCRSISAAIFASAALTMGCHHHHHHRHDGPAEHAGHHIDHAADRAGDVVEDAGRKVNRALPGD